MDPSDRSRSTHTCTDLPPVLAILGPGQIHRSCGRLRLSLAGSPVAHAVPSSLSFGTNLPSRAAPHPALQRRSCLRLLPGLCLREGNDFHILSSWFHGRTSVGDPAHGNTAAGSLPLHWSEKIYRIGRRRFFTTGPGPSARETKAPAQFPAAVPRSSDRSPPAKTNHHTRSPRPEAQMVLPPPLDRPRRIPSRFPASLRF